MKDPETTQRELLEEIRRGEEAVERMRELRDAHEGAAREDLNRRLRYCERLLKQAYEDMREFEREALWFSVGKDLEQL